MLYSYPFLNSRSNTVPRLFAAACVAAAFVSAPARADEADDQYAVASGHYSRGQWKFAADEFFTFLGRYPSHRYRDDARFFLGESLVQLGRFDEAAGQFAEYLKNAPGGRFARQARFRGGESSHFAGRSDIAGHELTLFRTEYPDDALNQYVLAYLGEIALAENKPDEARLHYDECLRRFPEGRLQDDCRLGLARILEKQGETAEAVRILETLADKPDCPVSEMARFRLGSLHYSLKQYEAAADAFSRVFRESPASAKAAQSRLAYGWSLFKLGRFGEAIAAFEVLESHPALRTEAGYWKGISQKSNRRWAEAGQTLRKTAAEAQDHALVPEIRFHAADAFLRAKDVDEASRQFQAVIDSGGPEAAPWKDDARLGLVQVAFARRRFDEVLAETDALLAGECAAEIAAQGTLLKAKALIMSARYNEAIALLESLEPSDEVRFLLATAYGRSGREEEAKRLFREVAAKPGPLGLESALGEAELHSASGAHEEAISSLHGLLEKNPELVADERFEVEGALATAHVRAGRFAEARKMHSEWAKTRPAPSRLPALTERLAEIAYEKEAYIEALAYFSWLALECEDPEYREKGLLGQGWAQYELGRIEEAGGTFGRVVDQGVNPSRGAEAALARGRILAREHQEDAALAMFDLVVERYPKTPAVPEALLESARILARLRQFDAALKTYSRIVEEFPQFEKTDAACYERAWVLYDTNRRDEAYAAFEQVYKEHRNGKVWADATYRLARQALEQGDAKTAERLTEELLAHSSGSPDADDALALRWRLAAARQDWRAVDAAAARLLAESPRSPLATAAEFWRAEAAFRQNDRKGAEERFDAIWEKHRGNREDWVAAVRLRRAQLAAAAEKWDDAHQIAVETKEQFPEFPQTYELDYVIGRSLAAKGEFSDARDAYFRVISSEQGGKTETAAMAQWMIGETFFHQEDFDTAAKAYLRVEILYDFPEWEALALLQAGKCHEKLQQSKEAADLYRRLIEQFPENRFAADAKNRLKRLE